MAFSSWFRHSALFSFHCILGLPMLYWLSLAYIAPVCLLTGTTGMWLDSVDSWLLRRKPVFAIGRWRSTQTSWRLHMNHCGISARRASPLCVPNVVIQRVPVYMSQKVVKLRFSGLQQWVENRRADLQLVRTCRISGQDVETPKTSSPSPCGFEQTPVGIRKRYRRMWKYIFILLWGVKKGTLHEGASTRNITSSSAEAYLRT